MKHTCGNSGCGCSETCGLMEIYTCGFIETQWSLYFFLNPYKRTQPIEFLVIHSLHKKEFNDDLFNVFLKILKSEHMNVP